MVLVVVKSDSESETKTFIQNEMIFFFTIEL